MRGRIVVGLATLGVLVALWAYIGWTIATIVSSTERLVIAMAAAVLVVLVPVTIGLTLFVAQTLGEASERSRAADRERRAAER